LKNRRSTRIAQSKGCCDKNGFDRPGADRVPEAQVKP